MLRRRSRQQVDNRIRPVEAHAISHVGKVRSRNEDAYLIEPADGVLIIADGMGGHQAGDVASQLATETVASQLLGWQQRPQASIQTVRERLSGAVQSANRAIFERSRVEPELRGMGTTLVAAIFHQDRVVYAHVGDSRLYRLRAGRLRQLTRDHSLMQETIDNGVFRSRAEAREAGVTDNVLTRSLGVQPDTEVDIGTSVSDPADVYLLCTDGLTGKLTSSDIVKLIGVANQSLDKAANLLCADALHKDGSDNITLVLARAVATEA